MIKQVVAHQTGAPAGPISSTINQRGHDAVALSLIAVLFGYAAKYTSIVNDAVAVVVHKLTAVVDVHVDEFNDGKLWFIICVPPTR